MIEQPLFSKLDADRILKRAAEIEGSEDQTPLTVAELRSIAQEAGFGPQAVERAIAEVRHSSVDDARRPPVTRSGLILNHISTKRVLPIAVSSAELMRAVRLFQPYRDGPAQVKLEEHQITWRDRRKVRFTVTSTGSETEINVYVGKLILRRGRWIGWVKAAADRLESLVYMVAAQDGPSPRILPPAEGGNGG